MTEREMDNCGSKSETGLNIPTSQKPGTVKEQRVDGSWQGGGASCLRCTLMDFERNYQVKILSNKIRQYSTQTSTTVSSVDPKGYNPLFVTGFTDAEGSFICSVSKYPGARSG
jgi:hypothetical protein